MSMTYHASFWYPRASVDAVASLMMDALPRLGFDGPEKLRPLLNPDPTQRIPTLVLSRVVHRPTQAEVYFSILEHRVQEGTAIQVQISAQEPQFRRNFSILVHVTSAMVQFDAMLIGFHELTRAHYGHIGAGGQDVGTWINGMDYWSGLAIEASKVLRDHIPLLDHINLLPKAMTSKFLEKESDLERYESRLRLTELHDEGLLIGFADCITLGGSAANCRQFAHDFKLDLDKP